MPDLMDEALDPQFANYVYAARPLVPVFEKPQGAKRSANLFLGEWMKLLDPPGPAQARLHVRYRGGEGYVGHDQLTRKRHLEIFFIDVSQGDGILLQTPEDRRILIDAGETDEAYEFIRNKYRLDKPDNYIDFDAVVASHSDADHAKGLIKILKEPKIAVKRFYHNGLFRRTDRDQDPGPRKAGRVYGLVDRPKATDTPGLTPLMKKLVNAVEAAAKNLPLVIKKMKDNGRRVDVPEAGFVCRRLEAADRFLPPYDKTEKPLTIEVLWPVASQDSGGLCYPWYGDAGKTVNGNSIVLCVGHGKHRILLTGDLNTPSMDDLLRHYQEAAPGAHPLSANVYKAAHHGSQDFSVSFLKAVTPDAAVISSGDDRHDVHGHPRAVLLGTITRYSKCEMPAVFSTELAACFTPLAKKEQKAFAASRGQLYEKSIQGIIHLRSDGKQLHLGCVHGRKPPAKDRQANILWKWDIWP